MGTSFSPECCKKEAHLGLPLRKGAKRSVWLLVLELDAVSGGHLWSRPSCSRVVVKEGRAKNVFFRNQTLLVTHTKEKGLRVNYVFSGIPSLVHMLVLSHMY